MKLWARRVVGLLDGHSWNREPRRHRVCVCGHACLCFPLSPHFSAHPTFSAEASWALAPEPEPVLAARVLPVCSLFLAGWRCVLHVLLFEHAQLLVLFFWEPLVPGEFASEDFLGSSEPVSPWLMLWAGDIIFSSAPSAILCWTQLILQVLLMWKLWRNGTDGYIAFSFLPSGFQQTVFGEPSRER